jgi:hypothetical protein
MHAVSEKCNGGIFAISFRNKVFLAMLKFITHVGIKSSPANLEGRIGFCIKGFQYLMPSQQLL